MVCKISIATKGAANKFTIGIKNIESRVELLNGTITVKSKPKKGVNVSIII